VGVRDCCDEKDVSRGDSIWRLGWVFISQSRFDPVFVCYTGSTK
jgi:hypothetical protein